jgi:hypothetical protein
MVTLVSLFLTTTTPLISSGGAAPHALNSDDATKTVTKLMALSSFSIGFFTCASFSKEKFPESSIGLLM